MECNQTNLGSPLKECKILINFGDLDINFKVTVKVIMSTLSPVLTTVYTLDPNCKWNSDQRDLN